MDPRFKNATIFDRRVKEWKYEKLKLNIENLFSNMELIDGWKFKESEWGHVVKKVKEELKRSIFRLLKITITDPNSKDIVYDIQIPELINNQFFYINGNLKIPTFQLFDHPIIYRKNLLKLRLNTISAAIDLKTISKGMKVSIFGKSIPMELLITAYHTKKEFDQFMKERDSSLILNMLAQKCYEIWEEKDNDEIIESLGSKFMGTNVDVMKKGKGIIFSLKVALEIDKFSKKFFKTNSILFEMLNSIYEGPKIDTDLRRKRVRFSEYILSTLIRKIYDMLLTLHQSHKTKFQIPQTIVMDACNVSDVVHQNLAINPVSEIASFCQITLTGPGGFRKSNVPAHLKNIDRTQYGIICPADTPDRDGCGVILNMVPMVNLKSNGNFKESDNEIVTSFPISLTPFLEHDDQVRLQMASNQSKQAILLKKSQTPLIKSGTEGCYLDKTTFLYKAKEDGEIVYQDGTFMIISYIDGTTDMIKLGYRNLYLNTIDYIEPIFKENDKFKKGNILSQSKFLKNEELSLGQNLLTGIAIWKGFNYEDGIVVSESVVKDKFTSVHGVDLSFTIEPGQVLLSLVDDEYKPLPNIGDKLKKGDFCAKIKTLVDEGGFESINIEPYEVTTPLDCTIISIEIYPNSWNKKVKEFDGFIREMNAKQTNKYLQIHNRLKSHMGKEKADSFVKLHNLSRLDCESRIGRYTIKEQSFGGILINIKAIYEEKIGIGDKISNRHGNKGVISKILPDDKMPILSDGRKVEIILNPLGIISRMNVGQLFELHLSEALYQLKKTLDGSTMKTKRKKLEYLKGFLDIIDKTSKKWITRDILSKYQKNFDSNDIYLIQSPFQSIGPEDLEKAIKYSCSSYKYNVFDPTINNNLNNPISIGYLYFMKLVHRASDKISSRSIGPYSKKTLQPLGGKSKQGGHRVGEMEVWALESHGAQSFLKDLLTVHSDSPGLKNALLSGILCNPELISSDHSDKRPQSLRLMESYLSILGLEANFEKEEGEG